MRRSDQIRNRGVKKRREVAELDITSLLDILVIILIFLLKNFNSSGVIINIPENIKIPYSESRSLNTYGINVQVSPSKIWVDDVEILNNQNLPRRAYDHGGRRIIPLFNELIKRKTKIEELTKVSAEAKKFKGIVNLIVDKSLKYSYLKKLMYTCANAGYIKYKFVVLSKE